MISILYNLSNLQLNNLWTHWHPHGTHLLHLLFVPHVGVPICDIHLYHVQWAEVTTVTSKTVTSTLTVGNCESLGGLGGNWTVGKSCNFSGVGEIRCPMSGHCDQRNIDNDDDCYQCDKHTNDSNDHFSDPALTGRVTHCGDSFL